MRPHLTPRKYILRLTSKIRNTPNISVVNTRILTYNILVCIADLSVLCGTMTTIPCSALLAQCRVVHRYVLEFLNEYFTILIFLVQVQNALATYFSACSHLHAAFLISYKSFSQLVAHPYIC